MNKRTKELFVCRYQGTNHFLQAGEEETRIQHRKGYNTSGREIEVMMNAYPITAFPTRAVYQYEVRTMFLSVFDLS
jgi:hypothetical protein